MTDQIPPAAEDASSVPSVVSEPSVSGVSGVDPTPGPAPIAGPAPAPIAAPVVAPVYPFAPVYKAPWINPGKRTSFVIAAVVAAVVLLGCGFVAGAAVAHHRDGNRIVRFERGGQFGPNVGRPGGFPVGNQTGHLPNGANSGRGFGYGFGGSVSSAQPTAPAQPAAPTHS
jgi:hypothetical protein